MPKETTESKTAEAKKPSEKTVAAAAGSDTPGKLRAMNVSRTLLTIGPDRRLFPPNTVAELSADEAERFRRRNLISILG